MRTYVPEKTASGFRHGRFFIPLKTLLHSGVIVTVNSDNRSVSNTNAQRERELLVKAFDLDEKDEKQLLQNSVKAAFCDESIKRELEIIIDKTFKLE